MLKSIPQGQAAILQWLCLQQATKLPLPPPHPITTIPIASPDPTTASSPIGGAGPFSLNDLAPVPLQAFPIPDDILSIISDNDYVWEVSNQLDACSRAMISPAALPRVDKMASASSLSSSVLVVLKPPEKSDLARKRKIELPEWTSEGNLARRIRQIQECFAC